MDDFKRALRASPLTETEEAILRMAREIVRVRDKTGERTISRKEAMLRKIEATAHEGKPHAQRHYMQISREAEAKEQALRDEEIADWRLYRDFALAQIERAEREGTDAPETLPHPDDIELDRRRGVRINGPLNAKELRETNTLVAIRDALIYQDALEHVLNGQRHSTEIETGGPFFLAMYINRGLPKRFRLSRDAFIDRRLQLRSESQRELLKQTRIAWVRAGGHDVRRGAQLPPAAQLAELLQGFRDILADWQATGMRSETINAVVEDGLAEIMKRFRHL